MYLTPTQLRAAARELEEFPLKYGGISPEDRDWILLTLRGNRAAGDPRVSSEFSRFRMEPGSHRVLNFAIHAKYHPEGDCCGCDYCDT